MELKYKANSEHRERLLLPESGVTLSTFRVTHPVKLASTVRLTEIQVLKKKLCVLYYVLMLFYLVEKSPFDNSVARDRRF